MKRSNPLPTLTLLLPHDCNTQFTNPVVRASLRIWLQIRIDLKQYSRYFPVANNHYFLPSGSDNPFQYWHRNWLIFFSNLHSNTIFFRLKHLKMSTLYTQTTLFKDSSDSSVALPEKSSPNFLSYHLGITRVQF